MLSRVLSVRRWPVCAIASARRAGLLRGRKEVPRWVPGAVPPQASRGHLSVPASWGRPVRRSRPNVGPWVRRAGTARASGPCRPRRPELIKPMAVPPLRSLAATATETRAGPVTARLSVARARAAIWRARRPLPRVRKARPSRSRARAPRRACPARGRALRGRQRPVICGNPVAHRRYLRLRGAAGSNPRVFGVGREAIPRPRHSGRSHRGRGFRASRRRPATHPSPRAIRGRLRWGRGRSRVLHRLGATHPGATGSVGPGPTARREPARTGRPRMRNRRVSRTRAARRHLRRLRPPRVRRPVVHRSLARQNHVRGALIPLRRRSPAFDPRRQVIGVPSSGSRRPGFGPCVPPTVSTRPAPYTTRLRPVPVACGGSRMTACVRRLWTSRRSPSGRRSRVRTWVYGKT